MKKVLSFSPFFLFLFLTLIISRPYFLKNQVLFPGNLLVSFYQPFLSYSWPGYPSGPPNKPIGFDNLRIFYPLRSLTINSFRNFSWPLWNPYDFSGNTQLATYQSAVFHPLSLLFFILPQIDAWSIIIILEPFLAMVFTYIFLRELTLSKKASVFGAVGFGLSGFIIVNMEESFMAGYSALVLPLILYGIEKARQKNSLLSFLSVTLGTVFSILSGWFQMTLYVLIFIFAYSIFTFLQVKKSYRKKFTIFLTLAFVFSFLISAIHLFPSFEAFKYSARGTTDAKFLFDNYLMPWYHLIAYVMPDFFGNPATYNYFGKGFYYEKILFVGIPVFLFGLYGMIVTLKKNKPRFFSIAWIITLSLGFSLPTSWLLLYYLHLPFISSILPSRIFFLTAFSLCTISAYGLEEYFKKVSKKAVILSIIIAGIILIAGWIYVSYNIYVVPKNIHRVNPFYKIPQTLYVSRRNLLLPTVLFILTSFSALIGIVKGIKKYIYYVTLIILCGSGLYFANKYLYFSDRQFTFPQVAVLKELQQISGNDRVWSFGSAYIDKNILTYYHLLSPEGYDSFSIQRYSELLYAGQMGNLYKPANVPRADATLLSAQNTKEIVSNQNRLKLLSLLGVKYIVGANNSKEHRIETDNILKPIWRDDKFIIYEYENVYPRVFLADDYLISKNNTDNINKFFLPEINLSHTIILERPINLKDKNQSVNGYANIINYNSNTVTISVSSSKNALLFFSDNYYPGWEAFIDNKEVSIFRADYSFRSIIIPKGKHVIKFIYASWLFTAGLLVSIFSFVAFILVCLKIRYNYKYA